jgi:hypothetical protein
MKIKSLIYRILFISNDLNAILKGRIGQRIWNKIIGRIMGRLMK